jgi:hypothetical protein
MSKNFWLGHSQLYKLGIEGIWIFSFATGFRLGETEKLTEFHIIQIWNTFVIVPGFKFIS